MHKLKHINKCCQAESLPGNKPSLSVVACCCGVRSTKGPTSRVTTEDVNVMADTCNYGYILAL